MTLIPLFAAGPPRALAFDAGPMLNPLTVKAPDLIDYVEAKRPQAIGSWRELGAEEYARAFTAARTAGFDVVTDLHTAFVEVMRVQGTEADFAGLVIPTLRRKGWLGGDEGELASRVGLIFDTNLRMARGAGQWDRIQRTKEGLPFIRAGTARDSRVRHPPKSRDSDHRAWDGIFLPVDHPFWQRWWVPLGFRCRCTVTQVSRAQAARRGYTITPPEELEQREARLGQPIFRAPGGGVAQQIADVVEAANARAMPGLPLMSAPAERIAADSAWAIEARIALVENLLNRLFG